MKEAVVNTLLYSLARSSGWKQKMKGWLDPEEHFHSKLTWGQLFFWPFNRHDWTVKDEDGNSSQEAGRDSE